MTDLPPDTVSVDEDGAYVVDPEVLASRLGLTRADLQRAMREGTVVSTTERGEGADAGRARLTFRYGRQAFAIEVEPDGTAHEVSPPQRRAAGGLPVLQQLIERSQRQR